MKTCRVILVFLLFAQAGALAVSAEDTMASPPFGAVHIVKPAVEHADTLVILISGDGGWIHAVVDLAEKLSAEGEFVVGVDIRQYLAGSLKNSADCLDAARDLQDLSDAVKNRYVLPQTMRTVLVGYSSGATLVYAAAAQAPANVFAGALSFGFCPDFEYRKPFCQGNELETSPMLHRRGLYVLPDVALRTPWIVFQGSVDEVCNPDVTRDFVRQVPSGEFVFLPKVGHGFAKERNWLPQFRRAFSRLDRSAPAPAVPST